MNHPGNGLAVDAWRNQPNHSLYNARIRQIKTIYRDKEPVDSLSNTTEKNCIAKLGFGNMYFDGKYFYLICVLETYPISYELNSALCVYKLRKNPSNGLIHFTHRYVSRGVPNGYSEFKLTYF